MHLKSIDFCGIIGKNHERGVNMSEAKKDTRSILAENLRLLIAKSGKSRQVISEDINVAYSSFTDWCNGNKYPRIEKIEILAAYFGVSVSALVGNEEASAEANPSDNRAVFAENLRFFIKKSGRTQKEIADFIGVTPATFNEWSKGKKYPRIEKIELLAQYFGITKAELIEHQSRDEHSQKSDSRNALVENLRYYMAKTDKSRKDVSEAIGVSYFTFSDWCNGKKYPRIEKLEALAKYFGISVPELVGEKQSASQYIKTPKTDKQEVLDIILRLHTDADFLRIVEKMSALDEAKLAALQQFLKAFEK